MCNHRHRFISPNGSMNKSNITCVHKTRSNTVALLIVNCTVHRIGRTGRCGNTGMATTFINKTCGMGRFLVLFGIFTILFIFSIPLLFCSFIYIHNFTMNKSYLYVK